MEDRLRELELKFASMESMIKSTIRWAGILGVLVLGWLGINTFIQIPNSIEAAMDNQAAKVVAEKLNHMVQLAEADSERISRLAAGGNTISISGQCFKPRTIVRCVGGSDHMTWVDNAGECTGAGYRVEGQLAVLAGC